MDGVRGEGNRAHAYAADEQGTSDKALDGFG